MHACIWICRYITSYCIRSTKSTCNHTPWLYATLPFLSSRILAPLCWFGWTAQGAPASGPEALWSSGQAASTGRKDAPQCFCHHWHPLPSCWLSKTKVNPLFLGTGKSWVWLPHRLEFWPFRQRLPPKQSFTALSLSDIKKNGRKTHRMSPAHQRASSQQSPDPAESAAPSQLKLWTCCSWDRKNMLGLGSCHLRANNTAIWGFRVSIAPPSYQWFANTEAKRSWQFEINFTVRPRTGIWKCHVPA